MTNAETAGRPRRDAQYQRMMRLNSPPGWRKYYPERREDLLEMERRIRELPATVIRTLVRFGGKNR